MEESTKLEFDLEIFHQKANKKFTINKKVLQLHGIFILITLQRIRE